MDALGGEQLQLREVGSQRQPSGTKSPELSPGSEFESQLCALSGLQFPNVLNEGVRFAGLCF